MQRNVRMELRVRMLTMTTSQGNDTTRSRSAGANTGERMQARSVQARLFAGGPRVWRERSREMRRWVSARAGADWVAMGSLMLGPVVRNAAGMRLATVACC